jgi:ABC-type amino acid transport substrate-binding protein
VVNVATVNSDELHFMLSKQTLVRDTALLQKLNTALATVKKAKGIEKILLKYGIKP